VESGEGNGYYKGRGEIMIMNPEKRWDRIWGRVRLFFGSCPRCNSDAPVVYFCAVCKQIYVKGTLTTEKNSRQEFPPNRASKALWWYTWMHPAFDSMQKDYEKSVKKDLPKICGDCASYWDKKKHEELYGSWVSSDREGVCHDKSEYVNKNFKACNDFK
jgi:hypothetical protein